MQNLNKDRNHITSMDQWLSIWNNLVKVKHRLKSVEVENMVLDYPDYFYNPFSDKEKNELYRIEVTKRLLSHIEEPSNIEKMWKMFRTLDYLEVDSVLFDLIPEASGHFPESDELFIDQICKTKEEDKKQESILKLYTDGDFFIQPMTIVGNTSYAPISEIKNNSWTIITNQTKTETGLEKQGRIAMIHDLNPDIATFPSKKELDSMNFPNITVAYSGEWGRKPWGHQARYQCKHEEIGYHRPFIKKR